MNLSRNRILSIAAIAAVAALAVVAAAPLAHAQTVTSHSAVLNWTAPTLNANGSPEVNPLTYNVYELVGDTAPRASGPLPANAVKLASGINALTYTVTQAITAGTPSPGTIGTILDGSVHCFTTTAVDGVQEGPAFNSVCVTFPTYAPGAGVLSLGKVQ